MLKAHSIRLNPTSEQAAYFLRAAGVARLAWNVSLEEYRRLKAAKEPVVWNEIKKRFRRRVADDFPFVREVTKCAAEEGIADLRRSISTYYKAKENGCNSLHFPGWRSRHKKIGGFGLANDKFRCEGHSVKIPRLGDVNTAESLRLSGKVMSGRVVERAGRWYLVIVVDVGKKQPTGGQGSVGIDFGLSHFAVCSDGQVYETQKYLRRSERKLRLLQRGLARKKKGSKSRADHKLRVARWHDRIANQRSDFTHKMTTELIQRYSVVCVEDLNLHGMTQTTLAKSVHDAGIGMAVRQLEYKANVLVKVSRWYPSSQIHHDCGHRNHGLALSDRFWLCGGCGSLVDRDANAALNIRTEGMGILYSRRIYAGDGYVGVTPVELAASTPASGSGQAAGCEAGTLSCVDAR